MLHFAGDGLLAGVVKKHDRNCHLDESGKYTASGEFDYPSLEEIFHVLLEKKISVIFAVEKNVVSLYDQIHGLLQDVTSVGILANDSSNILQLVEQGYRDFVRKVSFEDNAPEHISVTYKTTCGGKFTTLRDISHCDNVEIGKEYEFDVEVTLLSIPDGVSKQGKIKISETSLSSEELNIEINLESHCKCMQEVGQNNSVVCSGNGSYKCGACYCNPGW